jgi:alkylhydroperoxidase family enzyme
MPWIKMIDPGEAEGDLAGLYRKYQEPDGTVDNILAIHSLNPKSMQAHFDLYKVCMYGKSDLSRRQREMIAVVVSAANQCHY